MHSKREATHRRVVAKKNIQHLNTPYLEMYFSKLFIKIRVGHHNQSEVIII